MKKQNVKIEFDGEQEFFEAYCELLRNETGEEFEI